MQLWEEQGLFLSPQEERAALENLPKELFGTGTDFPLGREQGPISIKASEVRSQFHKDRESSATRLPAGVAWRSLGDNVFGNIASLPSAETARPVMSQKITSSCISWLPNAGQAFCTPPRGSDSTGR